MNIKNLTKWEIVKKSNSENFSVIKIGPDPELPWTDPMDNSNSVASLNDQINFTPDVFLPCPFLLFYVAVILSTRRHLGPVVFRMMQIQNDYLRVAKCGDD